MRQRASRAGGSWYFAPARGDCQLGLPGTLVSCGSPLATRPPSEGSALEAARRFLPHQPGAPWKADSTCDPLLLEIAFRKLRGLALRDRQRLPARSREVAREVDNLTDVIRRVRYRSVQRLDHQKRLPANRHRPIEILRHEGLDR